MNTWHDVFLTKWGWVGAIASELGLRYMSLPEYSTDLALQYLSKPLEREKPVVIKNAFEVLQSQLNDYFIGKSGIPQPVLDLEGATKFFLNVWEACRSIPAGKTQTYFWLAQKAGSPKAVRAAGQAMARNRVPLIIPCHRVIGRDGGLHGFAGPGIMMKAKLLELEGVKLR